MANKVNPKSTVGIPLQVYGGEVYTAYEVDGHFYKDDKLIAKRVELPVVQDETYRTQFFNPLLRTAIEPLTENTRIKYFTGNEEINPLKNLPTLDRVHGSIVFQVQPLNPITKVSVVLYQDLSSIILSDGSVPMEEDYLPNKSNDVATKGYTDGLLENFISTNFPLKDFKILQKEQPLVKGICYKDNSSYEILFVKDSNENYCSNFQLYVDAFALAKEYSDEATICIVVNETPLLSERIRNVVDGKSLNWTLVDSVNIYSTKTDNLYWKNSFKVEGSTKLLQIANTEKEPLIDVYVKVFEKGRATLSKKITYGVDDYILNAENTLNVSFNESVFESFKTKWVSGFKYFEKDESKVYDLPVEFSFNNNFLKNFRPEFPVSLVERNEKEEIVFQKDFSLKTHTPLTGEFSFQFTIPFTIKSKTIEITVQTVYGKVVYKSLLPLVIEWDESDESKRVTTPASTNVTPLSGYGNPWKSNEPLNSWDMKCRNNIFYKAEENSAICFKQEPKDCYSHAIINIEHDGEMYILSSGNTGWLSCQELKQPFSDPVKDKDSCLVNESYFSFGRVVYNTPVFIRILNATKVVYHGVTLN